MPHVQHKALTVFGANPIHDGHVDLMRIGVREFGMLTICIGKKRKPGRLPYEVRHESVNRVRTHEDFSHHVVVLNPWQSLWSLQGAFNTLVAGSRFLNNHTRFKPDELRFFESFPLILVLQIRGEELTPQTREWVQPFASLIEYDAATTLSSTRLRAEFRAAKSVPEHIPHAAITVIAPHLSVFNSETV